MEQLANLPLWTQILSMGSFMFASGVLMTRCPLAPIFLLATFGVVDTVGDTVRGANLTNTALIVASIVPFVIGKLCFSILRSLENMESTGPGIVLFIAPLHIGLWLSILVMLAYAVVAIICLFQLLISLSLLPSLLILACLLFFIGICVGIITLTSSLSTETFLKTLFLSLMMGGGSLMISTGAKYIGMAIVLIAFVFFMTFIFRTSKPLKHHLPKRKRHLPKRRHH